MISCKDFKDLCMCNWQLAVQSSLPIYHVDISMIKNSKKIIKEKQSIDICKFIQVIKCTAVKLANKRI